MNNKDMPAAATKKSVLSRKLIIGVANPSGTTITAEFQKGLSVAGCINDLMLYCLNKDDVKRIWDMAEAAFAELERRELNKQPGGRS